VVHYTIYPEKCTWEQGGRYAAVVIRMCADGC
jgi:hypothetical protein